ncbi:hypothetical protein [Enterococcus phage ECP3]|uniref:Uncharacterized protein n=2 Tax=Kochikohdavirus TaxID=2560160 RepID=A0A096XT87_9CAUD|nr:hypothetical protein [Enterococcus phage ECP3]AII28515.1 hypothetical protein [Enterococcus phage ECP3]
MKLATCPECGGDLLEGVSNEYGFECDTCPYPYKEEDLI